MVDQGSVISNPDYITQILSTVNQQFNDLNFKVTHFAPSSLKGAKNQNSFSCYII